MMFSSEYASAAPIKLGGAVIVEKAEGALLLYSGRVRILWGAPDRPAVVV